MKLATLSFPSLGDLAECMFHINVRRPSIDYEKYTFTAELTDDQIDRAGTFHATLLGAEDVLH
ncbi:hypothetical protein [Flaviaesturariibacter amylovorans]